MKCLPALRSNQLVLLVLWFIFNGSFTLVASALAMAAAPPRVCDLQLLAVARNPIG